jgi:hypothetical protein
MTLKSTEEKPERTRSVKIDDPTELFATWAFDIQRHQYSAFGVEHKQFVKNKARYLAWAKMDPPVYSFEVGDVFYHRHQSAVFLQVAADWDAFRLEVHQGLISSPAPRVGFLVQPVELEVWLRTGIRPDTCRQIDISESQAGLLQWQLVEKTNPIHAPTK